MSFEIFIVLGILLIMFSVPFIYNKMYPSKLYRNCIVVKLCKGVLFTHDTMTIEKEGQRWVVPISREMYSQLEIGTIIDFHYNHDSAVTQFELSIFND